MRKASVVVEFDEVHLIFLILFVVVVELFIAAKCLFDLRRRQLG